MPVQRCPGAARERSVSFRARASAPAPPFKEYPRDRRPSGARLRCVTQSVTNVKGHGNGDTSLFGLRNTAKSIGRTCNPW